MELSSYLQILSRRIWIILVTMVITVAVVTIGRSRNPVTYEVSTLLRIVPYGEGDPTNTRLAYADRIMNTYIQLASSSPVLEDLRARLNLSSDRPARIDVEVVPETELLKITVEDQNPTLAREAANTLAAILLDEQIIRDLRIYVVEPATTPKPPSLLNSFIYSVLALVVGLVGGLGLAFLFENLDSRLYSTEQIEAVTGLTLLSEIPNLKGKNNPKFLVDSIPYADAFRRLRVSLLNLTTHVPFQTLLITSTEPNEGKSTIVANLARSMTQTGRNIIVVDADLHCPTMHSFFDLPNEVGLSDFLIQNSSFTEVIHKSQFPGLYVLTSGSTNSNSAELLGSAKMTAVLERLKKQFDLVLIDTPAFLGIVDTMVLAQHVDGVALVARCGSVKEEELRTTCLQLESVQASMIGVIVNRTKKSVPRKYYKYYQAETRGNDNNNS